MESDLLSYELIARPHGAIANPSLESQEAGYVGRATVTTAS